MKDNYIVRKKIEELQGKMSNRAFAKLCGISEGAVRTLKEGGNTTTKTLEKIAKATDTDINEFFAKKITNQGINTGTATVRGRGIGQVNIASVVDGKQIPPGKRLLEVTEFEEQVIEGMRKYFPPARWEAIAAEIAEEQKKYR